MSNEIMYNLINGELVEVSEVDKAKILTDREEAIAIVSSNYYATKRASEYPPIGDQLDALWKGGEAAAEMLSKVQAVKTKYPKPE